MAKALYRAYRSLGFDEIIGQDHIVKILKNSIKKGMINHAYLFTGPRGVGKTSLARILAHTVNELEYKGEASHIDIIEIDAASNRRIDEIRDLRDKVHITPVSAKYKVYIIDEVHMLTKEAFNALLKTLEEPPSHVIFILATTEFHKLPETIVSRCLRLAFKPIQEKQIIDHLKTIAKSESIKITDDSLALIAEHGEGSFRDSISLLEQIASSSKEEITKEQVEAILGLASEELVNNLVGALAEGSPKNIVQNLDSAFSHGATPIKLSKQLSARLRQNLINRTGDLSPQNNIALLRQLSGLVTSRNSAQDLELALIEATLAQKPEVNRGLEEVKPSKEKNTLAQSKVVTPNKVTPVEAKASNDTTDKDYWSEFLSELKRSHFALYGVVRMAEPVREDNTLILIFKFKFHYNQINKSENKKLISDIVSSVDPEIKSLIPRFEEKQTKVDGSTPKEDPDLKNITNIFGTSEVLDS